MKHPVRWTAAMLSAAAVLFSMSPGPTQSRPTPRPHPQSAPSARPPAGVQERATESFWLWTGIAPQPGDRAYLRQRLRLSEKPALARLVVEARGPFTLHVNGVSIRRFAAGEHTVFITRYLDKGPGVLAFSAEGGQSAAGLRFELSIRYPDARTATVYSNGDEAVSRQAADGWSSAGFDDAQWARATVLPHPAEPLSPNRGTEPEARPATPVTPLPAGNPDTSRLVRIWDIRGRRKAGESPYASARMTGERMLLSAGMAPDADFPLLSSAGFTLLESGSDALGTSETAPGVWDLSLPDSDRVRAARAGFDWSYFPHFAFPPELRGARRNLTPIRCLEHDKPLQAYSPWDPAFLQYADSGLSAMARAFGGPSGVAALDLGIHGDYGEAGYFAGARIGVPALRNDWLRRFGDTHNHLGWWCGDSIARGAFRGAMIARYRTVEALNRAWQTNFRSTNDITYPASPTDGSRRRWLDFVHWYRDSATRMAEGVAEAARRRFPNRLLMLPLGFSDEDPRGGNDNSGLVKMAGRRGISARSTHGGFRTFAENQASMMGRIASAARFYDVPLWNEPTGRLAPEEQTARLFSAVSLGARGLFDWPENIKSSRDVYYRLSKHLRVEQSVVDVAMFFPTTSHLLRQEGYPQTLLKGCTDIRDVLNYDIVDEQMTLDGALSRYRILVLWEGVVVEAAVLEQIREWVEKGGVLVAYDFGKIETPEGDRTWFADLFGYAGRLRVLPAPAAGESEEIIDRERLRSEWAKQLGRGWTVFYPARKNRLRSYYEVVRLLTYQLSELDRTKRDSLPVDNAWDGIYATLLTDKVVYYNSNKAPVSRSITLPASALTAHTELSSRPTFASYTVTVEPGGMTALSFAPPPAEMLYQCEAFRSLNGLKPAEGAESHPGRGTTNVLLPRSRAVSTRIKVETAGEYGVFYRTTRGGKLAPAEIVLNGKTLTGTGTAPSAWSQTLNAGKLRLTPGVYTLTVRPPAGQSIRADFVVLSTDPSVAGYMFAER